MVCPLIHRALQRPPAAIFLRDPTPVGPALPSTFTQVESQLEGSRSPERRLPHGMEEEGTPPEAPGDH